MFDSARGRPARVRTRVGDAIDLLRRRAQRSAVLRRALRRRVLAAVVGVGVAVVVASLVDGAEQTRQRWGESSPVLVATEPIDAGELLDHSNTAVELRPSSVTPQDAATVSARGRRSSAAIVSGEAVVTSRLAGERAGPVEALLPEDTAGVTFERSAQFPTLSVHDHVDVLAPDAAVHDLTGHSLAQAAEPVARDAIVVATGPNSVTIAVDDSEVRDTAAAAISGVVAIVLVGER